MTMLPSSPALPRAPFTYDIKSLVTYEGLLNRQLVSELSLIFRTINENVFDLATYPNLQTLNGLSSISNLTTLAGQATAATIWTDVNDGSGSGLDADTLDGHDTAYFLAAGSYTAADVLTKIKTVDGSGSGLDADTLDTHDTSYFQTALGFTPLDVAGSNVMTAALGLGTVGQIVFPATQNASANANTLDDYEEGTWTPTLNFGGATTGITYSAQTSAYIKVGRLVYIFGRIILTSKGTATGVATITNLPFASNIPGMMATVNYFTGMSGLTGVPMAEITGAILTIRQTSATTVANVTNSNFTNTTDIIINGVYTTAN